MTDLIFTVLPIKQLVNNDGEPTMPHKLETDTKPSVSKLRVLLCSCVAQKATANLGHQTQKGFMVSLLEFHNIIKSPSSTYLVHGKYFLHMTLYLAKTFWCIKINTTSIFRGNPNSTSSLVYSVCYITL